VSHRPIVLPWRGVVPTVAADAFVAPGATVIGDVVIEAEASIWFGCVLRGDVNVIRVGARTNLQDGTVVHVTRKNFGTYIGRDVTIGHACLIHGCTLEDGCFIGMHATVTDGCVVESGAMLAAGALLPPGKRVPKGELWGGNPARFMRAVKPEEARYFVDLPPHYAELGREYREALKTA